MLTIPFKTDTPFFVYPDTKLSLPVTGQGLKMVARVQHEIFQAYCGMKNIERLLSQYRAHGLAVSTRFYESGRHEMLNEINREEVIADVIAWLKRQIA